MAQNNQKKTMHFDDILRSDALQDLPIGKCVAAGEKGEMMVCRTDDNEWIADGNGVQFKGRLKS
jgi:hypothetical protein